MLSVRPVVDSTFPAVTLKSLHFYPTMTRKPRTGPTRPEWAQKASQDLGLYYLTLNPNYDYVDYQQEQIVPALSNLENGTYQRLMIFIAAGHAKTDLGTKAFIPWFLGRNPNKNVILLCHTDPLSKDFGSHIRNVMTSNDRHRAVFPGLTVDSRNQASNFFRTNGNNAFYAFGMDGGFTGRRADLIVIEDPIKSLQDAMSDTVQTSLHNIYKAVVKDRLRPGGRILFIMTRWATRDLAARILDEEASRWQVLALPAQPHVDGCTQVECSCPYIWESYFGKQVYEEAKEDEYIWQSKWQQTPRPALNQGFKEEWLRFYLPEGIETKYRDDPNGGPPVPIMIAVDHRKLYKFNTYILVDPAMGKEAAHDRTAIIVLAAGPQGRLFVVDAVLDRLDPGERIDHLIRLSRQWKPKQIIYEEYALAADTYFLNLAVKAEGMNDLVVTSVGRKAGHFSGGRLKKHDRIMQLVPDFQGARIWFPVRMVRTLLDGSKVDIINYFINREYLPYAGEGSVAHDDMLDCLARIRDPDVVFEHRERPDDDDDEDYDSAGSSGSWESRY